LSEDAKADVPAGEDTKSDKKQDKSDKKQEKAPEEQARGKPEKPREAATKGEAVKGKIAELEKLNAEYKDALQRLQAEFENYKKRVEKEGYSIKDYGERCIVEKLLPVLDSFELALKNTSDHEKFKKGVELIYAQLYSILEAAGLKPIKAEGRFDPYKHEALFQEKSEEDGVVLQELQKGYMLKDEVIRHSKVKIGRTIK